VNTVTLVATDSIDWLKLDRLRTQFTITETDLSWSWAAIFKLTKALAISSGKALLCSAYGGANDQVLARVCVSNIPSEQKFSLQVSQIREGVIPETQPPEELSAQCSIWQVRSW